MYRILRDCSLVFFSRFDCIPLANCPSFLLQAVVSGCVSTRLFVCCKPLCECRRFLPKKFWLHFITGITDQVGPHRMHLLQTLQTPFVLSQVLRMCSPIDTQAVKLSLLRLPANYADVRQSLWQIIIPIMCAAAECVAESSVVGD